MANPLFKALGNQRNQPQNFPNPLDNFNKIVGLFNNFRQNFQGNPQAQVQELLNSGKMTQQQYDQLQNAAKSFIQMISKQ